MMRRAMTRARMAVLWALLASGSGVAGQDVVKDIALANAGAVDARMLQRLKTFAHNEMDVLLRAFDAQSTPIKALHECGQHYAKQIGTNDVCLIVLVAPEADIPMHMAMLPDLKVAIVNVKALASPDTEIFAQRLERQVMRSAAFLMGLPPSPEPKDVTRNYTSLADLDSMGRNFSAPWRVTFEEAARAAGLQPPLPVTAAPAQPQAGSSTNETLR